MSKVNDRVSDLTVNVHYAVTNGRHFDYRAYEKLVLHVSPDLWALLNLEPSPDLERDPINDFQLRFRGVRVKCDPRLCNLTAELVLAVAV